MTHTHMLMPDQGLTVRLDSLTIDLVPGPLGVTINVLDDAVSSVPARVFWVPRSKPDRYVDSILTELEQVAASANLGIDVASRLLGLGKHIVDCCSTRDKK